MENIIKEKIIEIVDELVPIEKLSFNEKHAFIGSNSIKAVLFLSAIEEEFEIEIDDDLINSRFFLDIEYMIKCIIQIKN